jgi:hypothetical protein
MNFARPLQSIRDPPWCNNFKTIHSAAKAQQEEPHRSTHLAAGTRLYQKGAGDAVDA